ncbi:hypothetical protein TNCV_4454461 [Trichonephila clavipes]|nr:hypothetical protein TNCV_4454461 [Trichonephila clavipes]
MADEDILELVHSSKNMIDTDSDSENKMNKAASVPTLFEMRNVVKSMLTYLDANCNSEMYNKMDDIEQFVENLMLKQVQDATPSYKTTMADHRELGVPNCVTGSRVFSLACPLGSLGPELMATLFQPNPRSEA